MNELTFVAFVLTQFQYFGSKSKVLQLVLKKPQPLIKLFKEKYLSKSHIIIISAIKSMDHCVTGKAQST